MVTFKWNFNPEERNAQQPQNNKLPSTLAKYSNNNLFRNCYVHIKYTSDKHNTLFPSTNVDFAAYARTFVDPNMLYNNNCSHENKINT